MGFQGLDAAGEQHMAEINVTPLVDVMLVLVIIFIVTAPLFTHAVRLDLPRARSEQALAQPDTVVVSLDADGRLLWNGERVGGEELGRRLHALAARRPQPEVHLQADRDTRYQRLAEVLSQAQRAGVRRFGLVTDPSDRPVRR